MVRSKLTKLKVNLNEKSRARQRSKYNKAEYYQNLGGNPKQVNKEAR